MKYIAFPEVYQYPDVPLIDVRTPAEYSTGHIPGAVNIPIFSDEERAQVGTRYHQAGKEAGFLLGLEVIGPKLPAYIKKLNSLAINRSPLILYCWRGGMRSSSMGWLFEQAGHDVMVITGGYKAYRSYIREQLCNGWDYRIIGGLTGSGKTSTLNHLALMGEQVVDLEELASHRGSVFGHLGQPEQPHNEKFENNLWEIIRKMDSSRPIFLEDESRSIGKVSLPEPFYIRMQLSPLYLLEVDYNDRVLRLVNEYGLFPKEDIISNILKINKYIGSEICNKAIQLVIDDDLCGAAGLLLKYYDKKYNEAIAGFRHREMIVIKGSNNDCQHNARLIRDLTTNIKN
ncbi:MAG TPA: tRNA 2-selenouridine(34) synthase MnmH [Lentimicrobium sp.]|nr:tRNA 2-selenouridine(34) synthase MnmH [Lentimicrobium sp.]